MKGTEMAVNGAKEEESAPDLDATASEETATASDSANTDEARIVAADKVAADKEDAHSASADVKSTRAPRSVSLSFRSLGIGAVAVLLVAAVAILGWLYVGARSELKDQAAQASNNARAEKMALDYASNAATMDYKDLQGWKVKLVQGTSPELNSKLTQAGTSMEQVLEPLQWTSSARPLVAKVRSNTGGVYTVDSFVSVDTKTIQSPQPLQSTATYSITIDSNNNWLITDVGGIGSALESK
jgi:hypothetical protein